MGKEVDYSPVAKVFELKKEKKRRLVASSDSETEEWKADAGVKVGGGERRVTRGETLRRRLSIEGGRGAISEASSVRTSIEIDDEPGGEKLKSESMDSVGNKADSIGGSDNCLESVKHRDELKESAKEKVLQSRLDRKRSMEKGDGEFSRKKKKAKIVDSSEKLNEKTGERNEFSRRKIKTEIVDAAEKQIVKTGRNKNSISYIKHTDRCMGSGKESVQASELLIRGAKLRHGDNLIERKLQSSPKRSRKVEAENGRWLARSGQRELRKLKGATIKEDNDGGSRRHNYVKMQGKSNVLRVLHTSKKDGGLYNPSVQHEELGKARRLKSSSIDKFSKSNHQFERQISEEPISTIKLGKRKGKVSSADTIKSSVAEVNGKSISQKKGSKNVSLFHGKSGRAAKVERHTKESSGSRSAVKNRLRDQIKNILLDAGWKIELRPRRGRNYEDAVYVSPRGTGYWSITKAYDVYIRQFDNISNDNDCSGKQSKASAGRDSNNGKGANSTPAVIPPEVLIMLKRKVVNKRRRKIDAKEAKIKLGVGRPKMLKENTKARRSRDDVGGARAMKRKVIVRNGKRSGCALLVRGSSQVGGSENTDYAPYVWKRTILSWMIDLGVLPAYGKVRYMNKRMTKTLLDGRITRDGIQCGCCSKILTISKFGVHAGSKLRLPYENIYVEVYGISILQCQINAWEKHEESKQQSFYDVDTDGDDPNDDTCGICGDGGDLICCDGCPSTFHLGCLGIQMLPTGDWHCINCSCKFCGAVYDSCHDGSASDSLLTCSQCTRKYHNDCVPKDDAVPAVPNSSCNMFCGRSCREVFMQLRKLTGAKNELDAGFSWSIIRRFNNPSKSLARFSERVECNSKIAVAYAVMDECFVPITDQRSGINLIHNVVYNCGSNFNRLNFSGFHTFILERGDEIVAAASVRIHGKSLAEMPFIGTRCIYRRQGMCRRLLAGIESALRSLHIEKLIIPAISELTDTWTTVFGFKPLEIPQKQEVKSVNILVFPGTGLLQKSLLKDSTKLHKNPEQEEKLETHIYEKADLNCSAKETIDGKESKSDAEGREATMPDLEKSTSNLLPEASEFVHLVAAEEKPKTHVYEKADLNCSAEEAIDSKESKSDAEGREAITPDLEKSTSNFLPEASEFVDLVAAEEKPETHVYEKADLNCSAEEAIDSKESKSDAEAREAIMPDLEKSTSNLLPDASEFVDLAAEKKPETHVYEKADLNCSAEEAIDSKESKSDAEGREAIMPDLEKSTSNLLPEASGINASFCRSSDSAAYAESNDLKHVSCSSYVEEEISLNCSNKVAVYIEETENVVEDVKDTLHFQHPTSEFLQGHAYGFEALESRSRENDSNMKLPITDVVRNYSSEMEGEYPLASLKKPKTKPPSNEMAHEVHSNKVQCTEANEDTRHVANEVKLRHDANELESDVNEDGVVVSVYVRSHLSAAPEKNRRASAGFCENGSGLNPEHNSRASNENNSQENPELFQKHLKCSVEEKDPAPLDQLAVSDSVKCLDLATVCGFVGTNPSPSECALNKLIALAPGVKQFVATAIEESDAYH